MGHKNFLIFFFYLFERLRMMYFIHSDVLHYCKYILVAHGIICTVLLARYVLIRAMRATRAQEHKSNNRKKWEYSIKVFKLCKRSSIMIIKITRICSVYFFSLNRIYAAKHLCLFLCYCTFDMMLKCETEQWKRQKRMSSDFYHGDKCGFYVHFYFSYMYFVARVPKRALY